MNRRAFIAATGIGAIAAPKMMAASANARPDKRRWSGLHKELNDEFGGNRPGCFAYASLRGQTLFSRGYGMADLENEVPINEYTLFRIASLTKPVTAVAVLALVDDGLIKLDNEIGAYLGDCPPQWRAITIRQLLSHISGISGDMTRLFSRSTEDLTPQELLTLYSELPLVGEPGGSWTYSNANYWLLGLLIETVSGKLYSEYLESRVFKKAGLEATRYGAWAPIISHRAHGYSRSESGETINAPYFSRTLGYAAGGILSTPKEMAELCIALGENRIISRDLVGAMMFPAHISNGKPTHYGLGWFVDGQGENLQVHHGGASLGFVSYLIWRPLTGAVAALFANTGAITEPKDLTEMMIHLIE